MRTVFKSWLRPRRNLEEEQAERHGEVMLARFNCFVKHRHSSWRSRTLLKLFLTWTHLMHHRVSLTELCAMFRFLIWFVAFSMTLISPQYSFQTSSLNSRTLNACVWYLHSCFNKHTVCMSVCSMRLACNLLQIPEYLCCPRISSLLSCEFFRRRRESTSKLASTGSR